ncbi:endonuclease domain-containing protein [Tistlia consotensis]|uniref:endonuclease domain-containing protein n=1 Tax=Tistlia consotensis TaxID=1321365 RepID=UPI002285E360|nr:DUF559 domain-containing protein [Tistlia consotensis]
MAAPARRPARRPRFRRQHSIGPYIVDLVCLSGGLVVEVDGADHARDIEADDARTRFLASHGFRVIRFWNHEVLQNPEGVCTAILQALQEEGPEQASPSPGTC